MRLPALAIGVASGVLAAIVLAYPTAGALARLAGVRVERNALRAAVATPVTALVEPALAVTGPAMLERRIRAQAARDGVLVEDMRRETADGRLIRYRLAVSGSSEAVLHFVDTLERGRPLIRFSRWRIAPAEGVVRLDGEVLAPWR